MPQRVVSSEEFAKTIGAVPASDDFAKSIGATPAAPVQPVTTTAPPVDQLGEAWQRFKDIALGTLTQAGHAAVMPLYPVPALKDALEFVRGIGPGMQAEQQRANTASETGHPVSAVFHDLAAKVPVVGPMAGGIVGDFESGHSGRALVDTAAIVGPALVGKIPGVRIPPMATSNPVARAAVEFGLREGIPVDAATATGNVALRGAQHLADRSIVGSMVARGANRATTEALETTGRGLAERTNAAGPMSREAVGEMSLGGVDASIAEKSAAASEQYGKLRAFEADPKFASRVPSKAPVEQGASVPPEYQAHFDALVKGAQSRGYAGTTRHLEQAYVKALDQATSELADMATVAVDESGRTLLDIISKAGGIGIDAEPAMAGEVLSLMDNLHAGRTVTRSRTTGYKQGEEYVKNVPKTSAGLPGIPGIVKGKGMGGNPLDTIMEAVNESPAFADKPYSNLADLLVDVNKAIQEVRSPAASMGVTPEKVTSALEQFYGMTPRANWWEGARTTGVNETLMPLAVDLRAAKVGLKPLLDRLEAVREVGGGLQGDKGQALVALRGLMKAPDFAPLSVVDEALSDLKEMARGADLPELRTSGQGTAAQAVKQLDQAVRATATKAGPEVLQALEEGRAATTAKYVAADVRKSLIGEAKNPEPVSIFNRLIRRDDTSVNLLRRLKAQTPGTIQNIGRAVVDELVGELTAKGEVGKARSIQNRWDDIGEATKRELFPNVAHLEDLNNFFELATRLSENPNPSGSGHTAFLITQAGLTLMNPIKGGLVQIGGGGLSKLLRSPALTRMLMQGLSTPAVNGPKVAMSLAPALLKAAGSDVVPIGLPAVANKQEPAPSIK